MCSETLSELTEASFRFRAGGCANIAGSCLVLSVPFTNLYLKLLLQILQG